MADEAREKVQFTDEEIRERMMSDPTKRERAEKLAKQVRDGEAPTGPRLDTEELADFLRDTD